MNTCFYIVKAADIAFICVVYVVLALQFAFLNDRIFASVFPSNERNRRTQTLNGDQLFIEITLQVATSCVFAYIGKNIASFLPSPLHNVCGLNHYSIKEFNSGAVLLMFLIMLQKRLQRKILAFRNLL